MHIKHLTTDNIIISEKDEKQHVIRDILQHFESTGKIANAMRYYAQIIHRESLENTGIGNTFAIPHARTETVDTLLLAFCVLKNPIEYDSFDGRPVEFVLLSLFPSIYSTTYLYYISLFANIFSNQNDIDDLKGKTTVDDIYSFIYDKSNNYYESIAEPVETKIDENANLAGVPSADLELLVRLDRLHKIKKKKQDGSQDERISELEKLIDNRSLSYYNRMRTRLKNPFAFVEKNACSGCNMNIPPTELNKRTSITICSNCGRFLLYL
jgi:mannitol/fructose-specific phosphotransferase system IIA component (Ntr-type)